MAKIPNASVALVVGVTGMAGLSLAEALKKPTALGGPWKVYGTARRSKPSWFPSSIVDHFISFDATNLDDTIKNLFPISNEVTHVFWVAIQVRENEEANILINSTMLKNVVDVLKSGTSSPLCHVTLQTGTKHYIGPVFDPSLANQLVAHEPPFHEDMPRLPYPNFYYTQEDVLASYAPSISYSVHRPSIIIGASSRSVYNTLLCLAVYANICKHQGLPFRYPGNGYTWEHFNEASDARVLAEQQIWAAISEKFKNQAFNCTNGDVFTWKSFWKELCKVFNVEFVPFDEKEKFDVVEMMKDNASAWDKIVEEHGLLKTKMQDMIAAFAAIKAVLNLEFQLVSNMTKSRDFGFFGYADTLRSIEMWVRRLQDMNIVP
ncbi:3-oxo-Delta(4,5)-steroid 5-beta-reductase-like [Durio zibethinus]|uniref:3-oxo-Delta(4,5)-steroid 5-beta-reductase-like n=1 Tax=Durio zibethinus TaxID=66656 RepID=A0A6P5WQJ9_DURZI|nr:3-oxo-Delta(4,5)-steroid 5-beta-reductase-like [Durio zibethinus]